LPILLLDNEKQKPRVSIENNELGVKIPLLDNRNLRTNKIYKEMRKTLGQDLSKKLFSQYFNFETVFFIRQV